MKNPFRREKLGLPIPDYKPAPAVFQTESAFTQLKIIRTHMAAQADQLSTLRTLHEMTLDTMKLHNDILKEIFDHLRKAEADQ